jgi:hypothetical protein
MLYQIRQCDMLHLQNECENGVCPNMSDRGGKRSLSCRQMEDENRTAHDVIFDHDDKF